MNAQLQDDFSDGDLSNDPTWLGQTEEFVVEDEVLRLFDEDPIPGEPNKAYVYLEAATSTNETTTWEFFIRMEFPPSGDNFAKVYLAASSPDLEGNLNGYYIRVGGISGSNDALELRRQDGSSSEVLITGTAGSVAIDPAIARVRVTRSPAGEWELLADYTGGTDYQSEGTATDATYTMGSFFGLVCSYTSTRAMLFYFDDILVDPLFVDTSPPILLSAEALSGSQISVQFDEPVDEATAAVAANFTISGGPAVSSAVRDAADITKVLLTLDNPLTSGESYTLTTGGIADTEGNISGMQSASFSYFDIQPPALEDVVISEIMADPSPTAGLPEGEYVELYNASQKVIDLASLGLSSGSTPTFLPEYLLLPGTYVAVVDEDLLGEYGGPAVGLSSFPALTNGGDEVVLTDSDGGLIFVVNYSGAWYREEERSSGGYSLELIQLEGPYDCPGNWAASQSNGGGTPGESNTWLGQVGDAELPTLVTAVALSDFELLVRFSEKMEEMALIDPDNYSFPGNLDLAVESVNQQEDNSILISLSDPLVTGQRYTLLVNQAVTDCMGNPLADNQVDVGIAEPAAAGDLIINELLFNPESGGADYLELYNRSDKALNINGLLILNQAKESGDVSAEVEFDYLVFPREYVVFTENTENILDLYTVLTPKALLENDLPTFDDGSGNVTIRMEGITIDSFDYDDDFHYPLLDDKEGVSLERISFNSPTQGAGNWHSAAATVGFGTPTYENSQALGEVPMVMDEIISLPRTTFSPDEDGNEDVLVIQYQTDQPGYTINARIFDSRGHQIKNLLNNELLATSGSFLWDGTTDEPGRARIGIYVLWLELFLPDGTVERDKRAVVLAGQ